MHKYTCHICGGMCDAGELENGVCYDCREEETRRIEQNRLQIRKEINLVIRSRYAEQPDGQLVIYGTN